MAAASRPSGLRPRGLAAADHRFMAEALGDMAADLAARRFSGLAWDADPASVIFLPGISTADRVDLHAGRGVGLDVVAQRVRAAGGGLAVHSEAGRYCAFRILLPAASREAQQESRQPA